MENSEKAKHIVTIVRFKFSDGISQYTRAVGDLAQIKAESAAWEKENRDAGGLGWTTMETQLKYAEDQVIKTRTEMAAREEILNYAIDVFLDKIFTEAEKGKEP